MGDVCNAPTSTYVATSSGIWSDDQTGTFLPHYIFDGNYELSSMYHSASGEVLPWLQVEFDEPETVEALFLTSRPDCCMEQVNNVKITVGNMPAVVGQPSPNAHECAHFEGGIGLGETAEITCDDPIPGKYLVLQKMEDTLFSINELQICVARKYFLDS